MLVSLRWLAEWVDLPDDLGALADRLTMSGLEVDSAQQTGPDLSTFVVGHVVEREPHPDADRLSLCRVDVAAADGELLPIVCGAPNVAAGQKVVVALPGTRLPDGTKIKKSKIRGVRSMGMICSESELGLGDGHEGIVVLDPDVATGSSVAGLLSAGDTVLEVAILANRGDCTSMLGIAREVRAYYGGTLRVPECAPPEGARAASDDIGVEIEDGDGCYRYVARVVRGVKVGPSPEWVVEKLEAAGLRPVNNVVDVTNLVLLEFGQPLHAFDLAKLHGGIVSVRKAGDGESLRSLDSQDRKLETHDLVIADAERAIAIAGVMGGAETEVSETTTDILIESAHFHPGRVRRTARRLGLTTDASYRFEREVDGEGIGRAADRAALLIAELAGGEVSAGRVEALGEAAPHCAAIELSPTRVNRLLGTALGRGEIVDTLARLEIELSSEARETLTFRVPSFRNDLSRPQDLIEEVARIHGFDAIPAQPQSGVLTKGQLPEAWVVTRTVTDLLRGEGLTEVQSFPFMDPADLDRMDLAPHDPRRQTLGILNPIVDGDSRMRSSLLPTLLRLAVDNLNRQADVVRLFEVARVFRLVEAGALPEERLRLTAVVTQPADKTLWDANPAPALFFVAKGIAERLLAGLGHELSLHPGDAEPYLHPGGVCVIRAGKAEIGMVGELHPACAAAFEIAVPCAIVELDLSAVSEMPTRQLKYREVSRFPQMRRDLAVLLGRDQRAGEVLEAIRQKAGSHLTDVEIFDRYEGKAVPAGKVSLAFRLTYQRLDRTLTDGEVTKATERVVKMLADRFGGELR